MHEHDQRFLRAVVLLVIALAFALPAAARAGCAVETLEMPVRMIGSRAVATVGINGTPVALTVDSGAFFSFLTDAVAAQLKLPLSSLNNLRVEGITGPVDAQKTRIERLKLFKGEIDGVEFIVGGNEPGAGTVGLMGRNILSIADTEYDLAHGVIRVHFPNDECAKSDMAYWAGSTPVTEAPLIRDERSKVPSIRAVVSLNGNKVVALFDTGATTLVTTRGAKRAGLSETDLVPAGMVYGAGRGSAKAWTAPFERFELGGEVIHNNRLRVADISMSDSDMILGIDFFLAHRIYVSKQQSKLFVTYNGGPVFALDRAEVASAAADGPSAAPPPDATADQLARRGAASAARRDFASALADLDRACALEPDSAALFAQRASIQVALKRPAKAREDFDRALELDPAQIDARLGRASVRLATGDRIGANADLDALDARLAAEAPTRLSLSNLYLALDEPAKAVAQLDRWLAARPNDQGRSTAFNNRCWARVMMGTELAKALADCDRAVADDAKNPRFLDSRGWVFLRLGEPAKALGDFDRSVEHDAKSAWSRFGRGLARTRLGDTAAGDADLAAARALQPDIEGRIARLGMDTVANGPR